MLINTVQSAPEVCSYFDQYIPIEKVEHGSGADCTYI